MKLDLGSLELKLIDGEMALTLCLGRRSTDPTLPLDQIRRSFRYKGTVIDTVDPFLAIKTRRAPGGHCKATPLQQCYEAWCGSQGQTPLDPHYMRRGMLARNFKSKHLRIWSQWRLAIQSLADAGGRVRASGALLRSFLAFAIQEEWR